MYEVTVQVRDEHQVGQAQLTAKSFAMSLGMSRVVTYTIATAVSELANNLFFHASGGGTIRLVALKQEGMVGVEVIAEDDGPGIANVKLAMQDGFTTAGGLGGGLPGVKRLMDEFEITSSSDGGTRIVTRKWQHCS